MTTRPLEATSTSPTYQHFPWDKPEFTLDPYPWYARALREAPVIYDDLGFYIVSRYEDVMEFGKHPSMSVEPGWDQAGPWAVVRDTVIGKDLPDHTRLRRQTNKWFGPKVVDKWTMTTKAVTDELLAARPDNLLDGWHDLSVLPTHQTMCRVLGVTEAGAGDVQESMFETMPMLAAIPERGTLGRAEKGFDELTARLDELIEEKRQNPDAGLLSTLLSAAANGEISDREARATALMLYSLGHMDVGYLIAAGLNIFAARPDIYARYRYDGEVRDAVINEIARYDPPELCFYRVAKSDIAIRSVEIPAGSKVRFMIGAANRDPDVFSDPQEFTPDRPSRESRNLSFGVGSHSCVGQHISRAQARVVFDVLADHFSGIEFAGAVEMDNTDFSRHFTSLPLRLIP